MIGKDTWRSNRVINAIGRIGAVVEGSMPLSAGLTR
jgi:hypothetical protein